MSWGEKRRTSGHRRGRANNNPTPSSGGTFADALAQNRREAGIEAPAVAPPQPVQQPAIPATQPDVREAKSDDGGLIARSSWTTKIILIFGVLGIFLYLFLGVLSNKTRTSAGVEEVDESSNSTAGSIAGKVRSAAAQSDAKAGARQKAGAQELRPGVTGKLSQKAAEAQNADCTPEERLRTMGTQFLESGSYATGVPMVVKNTSDMIAFMDFTTVGDMALSTTLLIMPGEMIKFPTTGRSMLGNVSVGSMWCNRKVGWQDARTTSIRPSIFAPQGTVLIRGALFDKGGGLLGFRVFYETPGKQVPRHFL